MHKIFKASAETIQVECLKQVTCNTGFPFCSSNVILSIIQQSQPEANEAWWFLGFHHLKIVRFLKTFGQGPSINLEHASGSCRRILPLVWVVLVSFAPCLTQELLSPHQRYLFLPQKGKGREPSFSRPTDSLLQVCERKEEKLL